MKTSAWAARLGLGLTIVVLAAGMTVLIGSSFIGNGWSAEPGHIAADFRLPTPAGTAISLSELRGDVVAMLVVPADQSCPPALISSYRQLLTELPPSDVHVLAITTEPGDPLLRADLPGTTLLDRGGSVASQYMVRRPTWFVIDADGTIRHRAPAATSDDKLLTAIRALIAPDVPVPLPGNV